MAQEKMDSDSLVMQGQKMHAAGNVEAAENFFRQALVSDPRHAKALYNMAFLSFNRGQRDEAIDFYRQAIAARSGYKEAYYNLGVLLQMGGRLAEAREQFLQAVSADAHYYEGYMGLGSVLRDMREYSQALENYKTALSIHSNAHVHTHIGFVYKQMSMPNEAADHYRRALEWNPEHLQALNDLGSLYIKSFKFEEARNVLERALKVDPNDINIICNVGIVYSMTGQPGKAIENYRRGLQLRPDFAPLYSNLLLAMVYAPGVEPAELTVTAEKFGRMIADPLWQECKYDLDRNPARKLRVGYVSGDFRKHAVCYFVEQLIKNHDRSGFEIYAYSNLIQDDATTMRMKGDFDHWRDIYHCDDDEVVNLIEADKIDILVDLAGHTDGNRLLVFARKPAPVQVTWLGYPATTGMKAMDYRISDAYAEPVGAGADMNVEELWRLPHIFCCYGAPGNNVAVIDHPPCEDNGYITFGCFNNFAKITDAVLQTWAEILRRVPDSRLLLEIAGMDNLPYQTAIKARLQEAGFPPQRVILKLRRPENQFVLYNRVDIALDPFPCNGGTTSMDTLWMGVPFVALAGGHFVSRMGVTILSNAGLPELIARDRDEYIAKAVDLATDREKLKRLRHGLREKVMASPVMDQALFVKDMEEAYRAMWARWCAGSDTE